MHPNFGIAAVALMTLLIPLPAVSAEGGLQLEEVVVTARKREESMQDAPLSVSAFSSESMERQGITHISSLEDVTPGLDMNAGNSGVARNPTPYIRGVGQRLSQVVVDPSVAMYYAGVYQGRMLGTPMDVVDLHSVEVLRGPQGTLFGKNVTGGAILMNPHRPEDSWFFSAATGLSNNEGEQHSVTANMPLADGLALRLNYNRTRSAGHMENVLNGKEHGDDNRETWVAQFRWDVSEALSGILTYAAVETRQTARAVQCLFSADELGWDKNNFIVLTLADNVIGADFEETCDKQGPETRLGPAKVFSDVGLSYDRPLGNRGWRSLATPNGGNNFTESDQMILQLDYEVGTPVFGLESLKSISGWLRSGNSQHADFDGTEIPLLSTIFPDINAIDQYSQEFQLNFALLDEKLLVTSGAYFFLERSDEPVRQVPAVLGPLYNAAFNPAAVSLPGLSGLAAAPAGGTAVFGIIREVLTRIENDAAAVYAQFDYSVSEQLDFGIGLRWTAETRHTQTVDSDLLASSVHPQGNAPAFSQARLIAVWADSFRPEPFHAWQYGQNPLVLEGRQKVTQFSPMVNLKYNFSESASGFLSLDHAQAYLTWSEGFRSGGIERGVDEDRLNTFDPEFVENIEIGLKTEALDRRLRANLSAYYSDYKDIQLVTTRGGAAQPIPYFVNAGKALISGLEAEISAVLGNHWIIASSLAYTNADLKEYDALVFLNGNQQVQADRSDEDMPRVSEKAGSLSISYLLPVERAGEFSLTAGFNYRSEQTTHFDRGSFLTGEYVSTPRLISTLRAGWISADDKIRIAVYAENLDSAYTRERTGGIPLVEATGAGSFSFTGPTAYGLSLRYTWDGR